MKAEISVTLRRLFLTLLVSSALLVTAGCSASSEKSSPDSSVSSAESANAKALLSYVDAERATIPQIMSQYPGLYSEVRIEGSLEESDGSRGLSVGTHSVVWFYYTYANPVDWSSATTALDGQRATIDSVCDSTVFPAMRNAGIIGPMGVVYSYDDGQSAYGAMWEHTCTAD
ncbi:hypothetical protein [Plantibacter sp. T3]|uniref:hypothetical protein n=1 Tax=Plantibacter sp. T3 TaxID=2653161 RepID=UPI0012F0CF2B|nr:hypothetical protein [Plantibacter sp. T3]VXB27865.1 conserved exported hypothetical protein [Plantibacter sp. T3]